MKRVRNRWTSGVTGSRTGLRSPWEKSRVGSSPTSSKSRAWCWVRGAKCLSSAWCPSPSAAAHRPPPSAHRLVPACHNDANEDRVHRRLRDPQAPVRSKSRPTSSRPRSTAWRKGYTRTARVPGLPARARCPRSVVRQRYKDQILYDVAHDLIPRAGRRRAAASAASSRSRRPTSATSSSRRASR